MKVVNIPSTDRVKELRAEEYGNRVFVIPGHRAAMNPESRDSGFDAFASPRNDNASSSLRGATATKQSIYPLCSEMDCCASLAMTDTPKRKWPGKSRPFQSRQLLRVTPGSPPSCRARPAPRRGERSARGRASTRRNRARSRGRTPPKPDRRHVRRRCRP